MAVVRFHIIDLAAVHLQIRSFLGEGEKNVKVLCLDFVWLKGRGIGHH